MIEYIVKDNLKYAVIPITTLGSWLCKCKHRDEGCTAKICAKCCIDKVIKESNGVKEVQR